VLVNLAAYFATIARKAINENGKCSVALSGGSSPKKLYELLSSHGFKDQVEWPKMDFFFGDERFVPQTDSRSNYLMAKKALFDPLSIDPEHIFAVDTSLQPVEAADKYAKIILNYFDGEPMKFDIILLGLGDNAHTASLFPNTSVLTNTFATVKAVFLEDQKVYRITFTAPLINQARYVAFLVYGESKAVAVKQVIEDSKNVEHFPAQLIKPLSGNLEWFLDEAAAKELKSRI